MKLLSKVSHTFFKRLMHSELKKHKTIQWIKPEGFKTDITLYNSLLKSKYPLILRNKNVVTWYMCGPTLYDSAHIGHARYLIIYLQFHIRKAKLHIFYNNKSTFCLIFNIVYNFLALT